jgi:hypothetical protein
MATATLAPAPTITMPAAAMRLGVTPDKLRCLARKHPDVAAYFTAAGPLKLMDPEKLKDLRATIEPLLASGQSTSSANSS